MIFSREMMNLSIILTQSQLEALFAPVAPLDDRRARPAVPSQNW